MGNKPQYLVFDLDGTIIAGGQKVSVEKGDKLRQLAQSNQLIFASARPVRDMLPLLPEDLHDATYVGCNGGQVWSNGQMIYSNHFAQTDTTQLISHLDQFSIPYVLDSDWNYAFSGVEHDFHHYVRTLSDCEVDSQSIAQAGMTKILILDGSHSENVLRMLDQYQVKAAVHYHKQDDFFDLTPQATNKALALSRLGIDGDKMIAAGNDHNDHEMLRQAKTSIFVGSRNDFDQATCYCDMDSLFDVLAQILKY